VVAEKERIYFLANDTQLCQDCYNTYPDYSKISEDYLPHGESCDGCGRYWDGGLRNWVAMDPMEAMRDAIATHGLWERARTGRKQR
jgi:hypothetical protein